QIQRIRQTLGLNDPIPVQYVRYMVNLAHGDLGTSLRHPGVKVSELIFPKMAVSAQLLLIPSILIFVLGLPLGIYTATRRGHWQDPFTISSLLFVAAIPELLMIPVLQVVFAIKLKWLPVGGWDGIFSTRMILPGIVLTVPALGGLARWMRGSMLSVMGEDFIRTARAKGLAERVVLVRHVARNAMLPIVTFIVYTLIGLFTGDLFVELLFGVPGLGREILSSINSRDYDEFMAITIIGSVAFILANLILDIVYTLVDPRISYGSQ
ncbi:MAG TPA: ABC transporter permease, partial [Dehalococcoidia bacterium]|nr:ABC transporter permease [Dehalococcoidia bacterium]